MISKKISKLIVAFSFSISGFLIAPSNSEVINFEECNKLEDAEAFRKCISKGKTKINEEIPLGLVDAIRSLDSGDPGTALTKVNNFLKNNKNSKEAYLFRALINNWDFDNMNNAMDDLNRAIEIDDQYVHAYALRGQLYYWELSNKPAAEKDFKKALSLSPNNTLANYLMAEYLFDFALAQYDQDKKDLALKSGKEAVYFYEKVISNENLEENFIVRRIFPFGIEYDTYYQLGDLKFEIYFLLKELKDRKLAKEFLNQAIGDYTSSIKLAPTQEAVTKLELDMNYDMISPAELYLYRGNAYSWVTKNWKKACKDWKVSKKYGNKDAQTNVREWRC